MAIEFSLFRTRLELVASPHTADLFFCDLRVISFFPFGQMSNGAKVTAAKLPLFVFKAFSDTLKFLF